VLGNSFPLNETRAELNMVVRACNLSNQEAEAGVGDQPWLHSETLSQKKEKPALLEISGSGRKWA
jgi:hypothetical protein